MRIPKEKKKQILSDKDHLSINEISKKYNLPRIEVKNLLNSAAKKTPPWFYLVLILIPLLFLVILEMCLRLFNYGYDSRQWVDAGNAKYIINPEIGKKYFYDVSFRPATDEDVFDQQKKVNAFRVFILGESSAAGFPFIPTGSFSRYIRRRLELAYPNSTIEVVNISMTAINSYTILDLLGGVLDQHPDLILIYTGHNEYYGALGVGSMESLGNSRTFIKLVLYLENFKVTQLVRNSIHWVSSIFSSGSKNLRSGTLMSRMAKDQYIKLKSEKFNEGIEQFRDNLHEILSEIKNRGVPVILGRLVSNLKDQKPFISINTPGFGTADNIYNKAQSELNNNTKKADSLFRLAKDLDALRFRAPEKFNSVIDNLGKEFHAPVIPFDSIFDSQSPNEIVGDNLIVDHLHPNIEGYQLMGKAFFEAMEKMDCLPKTGQAAVPFNAQDSVTKANFIFTHLDSVIGNYTITLLKNDWPFVKRTKNPAASELFQPKSFIDSIALSFIEEKISWPDAHLNAASIYLRKDDIKNYLKHMDELIYQYPNLKDFNSALRFFYENHKINPADYTTKRLGIISLYQGNYNNAISLLSEADKSHPGDTLILYSLAQAYFRKEDFKNAQRFVDECLGVNPYYPEANNLKRQILIQTKLK